MLQLHAQRGEKKTKTKQKKGDILRYLNGKERPRDSEGDGTGRPEKNKTKKKSKKTKRSIDYVAMKSPEETGRVTHENLFI